MSVGRAGAIAVTILPELGYALFLQACFVTSFVQILLGRKAGWNYVPRPALPVLLAPWLIAFLGTSSLNVLPASILQTDWYAAPWPTGSGSTRSSSRS